MIPLIDISLVLLIFFMMTASAVTTGASTHRNAGCAIQRDGRQCEHARGSASTATPTGNRSIPSAREKSRPVINSPSREELLQVFASQLQNEPEETVVRIRAHRHLPYEVVRGMVSELEKFKKPRGKLAKILAEVSEKQAK